MWLAAIAVAVALWGPAPCAVQPHVAELGTVVRDGQELRVMGLARPTTPWGTCEVLVDEGVWTWGQLCSVMVHEYGHQYGLGHSPDPMNVMHETLWRTADACRGKAPPGRAHALVRL